MIDPKERYEYLSDLMRKVYKSYEGTWKSRKRPIPQLRALIWYQMRQDGYSSKQIGSASGFAHCTVIIQTNNIKDIISSNNPSWRDIISIWKKFKLSIAANPQQDNTELNLRAAIIREILDLPKEERIKLLQELKNEIQNQEQIDEQVS